MLELYYFPTATRGPEARLAAGEKGIDYGPRVLAGGPGDARTPAFARSSS